MDGTKENKKAPTRAWIVMLVSCVGVFMASVSTSALIIAFPELIIALHMSLATMMWVLLIVMLVIGAMVGIAGKLGDIIGQANANLYKFGYVTFLLGSLGGGFCVKENQGMDLIAARCVIGFGAAFLFTNSSAILTNTFEPYGLVGMSQGLFNLSAALGMVLGPLIGGAFATVDWRWIFFFNIPLGGPAAALAMWAVQDVEIVREADEGVETKKDFWKTFDWVGAFFYPLGLILLLIAMIQGVIADPILSKPSSLAGLIIGGCICGIIFVIDQCYAADPLFAPTLFLNSKLFTITTIGGTCMSFARYSITYNMIFYLQGPHGMNPLQAGIALIPFGIGVMAGGVGGGALSDRFGVREMSAIGPIINIAACSVMMFFDKTTSEALIGGMLFLSGFGIGLFTSPNGMVNMLSVLPSQRGAASGLSILTMMFVSMVAIVITFSFVLNSMSQEQLFVLFIYGGANLSDASIKSCIYALKMDYYIIIATSILASLCGLANDYKAVNNDATIIEIQQEKSANVQTGIIKDVETPSLKDYELVESCEE